MASLTMEKMDVLFTLLMIITDGPFFSTRKGKGIDEPLLFQILEGSIYRCKVDPGTQSLVDETRMDREERL
jgi:hypothetical protein